jgi:hypothetical protein
VVSPKEVEKKPGKGRRKIVETAAGAIAPRSLPLAVEDAFSTVAALLVGDGEERRLE